MTPHTNPLTSNVPIRTRPLHPKLGLTEVFRSSGFLAVVMVAMVLAHLLIEGVLTWEQRLLGVVPGLMAAYGWWSFLSKGKWHRLPFIEYGLLQVYVAWGFPTLTYERPSVPLSAKSITETLEASILTCIIFVGVYPWGMALGRWLRPIAARIDPGLPTGRVFIVYVPWLLIALLTNSNFIGFVPDSLKHVAVVVGSYYPLLAFAAIHQARTKSLFASQVFYVTSGLLIVSGLSTGMTEQAIRPIIVAGILILLTKRAIPLKMAGVVIGLVIILQPAKFVYRKLSWYNDDDQTTRVAMMFERWSQAIEETWFGDNTEDNAGMVAKRINELPVIAITMDLCPDVIPYNYGAEWKYIPILPVPRLILPSKPEIAVIYNNHFNITFGFQTEETAKHTTLAFPLISDGYWNFGWFGIAIAAAIIGLLLGTATTVVSLDTWFGLSLAVCLFGELHSNNTLAYQIGGVFQSFVGIAFSCWLVNILSGGRDTRTHLRSGMLRAPPSI